MGSTLLLYVSRATALGLVITVGVLFTSSIATASILAQWTFETSVPTTAGPFTAEGGSNAATSFASGFHAGTTTYSNPVGNGSLESFSSTGWAIGDYYQFRTSTSGFENITVGWDQTRSSTGPSSFLFQYSTDGSTFTNFPAAAYTVPAISWSSISPDGTGTTSFSRDLSAVATLDNVPSVYFRLTSNVMVASGGTNRVDNFVINGTAIMTGAVPEASAFLIWSLLCGSVLVGVKRLRDVS